MAAPDTDRDALIHRYEDARAAVRSVAAGGGETSLSTGQRLDRLELGMGALVEFLEARKALLDHARGTV